MWTASLPPLSCHEPALPIAALGISHSFIWLYANTFPPFIYTLPTPPVELKPIPPPMAVPVVVATAVTFPPDIVITPLSFPPAPMEVQFSAGVVPAKTVPLFMKMILKFMGNVHMKNYIRLLIKL